MYKWFTDIVKGLHEGTINTDEATLNYITLDELDMLEEAGVVKRVVTEDSDIVQVS